MPVTQASTTAFKENHTLIVRFDFANELACLTIINYSAARYFDDFVLTVFSKGTALSSFAAIGSHDVLLILEVQERPQVAVAVQNYRSSFASITSVRSAFGQILGTMKVHTACTALTRAAVDFYIVDKIARHNVIYDLN
jgi:hypothetical protein